MLKPVARFLLPLLLTACASSAPREFRQAAPAPAAFPVPGFTPPGTGAPVYEPNAAPEERPELPPSPHWRVLPQTPETRKEPGLWAADEPQAARKKTWPEKHDPFRELFGVRLRPEEEVDPDDLEQGPIVRCSLDLNAASFIALRDLKKMSQDERSCMAGLLYRECFEQMSTYFPDSKTLERFKKSSEDMIRDKCTKGIRASTRETLDKIRKSWR